MTQVIEGYSAAEAARRLNLTPNMVRVMMGKGRLEYIQTPIGRLIVPEDLERERRERAARAIETTNRL